MKFTLFETIVDATNYMLSVHEFESDYPERWHAVATLTAGYLTGTLYAVVSHPSEVMVAKLNAYHQASSESFGTASKRILGEIGCHGLCPGGMDCPCVLLWLVPW